MWRSDAAAGTSCGKAEECLLEPACDGDGACSPAVPTPPGSPCGDATDTECNPEDICDGAGGCDVRVTDPGIACGDPANTECTDPDTCNGTGDCSPRHAPGGTACGDQGQPCFYDDACDDYGQCTDNGAMLPCLAMLTGTIRDAGGPLAGALLEVLGASPPSTAMTDDNGVFSLAVPLDQEVRLLVGATGHWGSVLTRTFTMGSLSGFAWTLRTDAEIAAIGASLGPPLAVDPGKGVLHAVFGGSAPYGGSYATQTAANVGTVAPTGPNTYVYSMTIVDSNFAELWFFNTELGATAVTAFGNGLNTCNLTGASNPFPVVAHAMTEVDVTCY
ncbi:MAG: hypothetical protein FD127_4325 [Acidimicrobiaceae bacterium]|nr:MAG: hypothetical protein FD127_4325 [Acidimicrobiaceae bacterium]